MYSIGEFSKIAGLSIKTLRFYHEKGLLNPTHVEPGSGYRYYDHRSLERARVIRQLRELEFSLSEINEILAQYDDEADILDYLERQKQSLEDRIDKSKSIVASIDEIIAREKEVKIAMQNSTFRVEEKSLPPLLIAAIRMKGKYCDCGQAFAQIGKRFGRFINGKPLLLHYDHEYREDDADFEVCMPVRQAKDVTGITVRELPGGRCVSLLHKGPYDQFGRSYETILNYVNEKGYRVLLPTREVYLKGPGRIFTGNPKKYLTEIQMLIDD